MGGADEGSECGSGDPQVRTAPVNGNGVVETQTTSFPGSFPGDPTHDSAELEVRPARSTAAG